MTDIIKFSYNISNGCLFYVAPLSGEARGRRGAEEYRRGGGVDGRVIQYYKKRIHDLDH